MSRAHFFADNMVERVGVPVRFRGLVLAAYKAAGTKDYVVDLTGTRETGEPCEESVIRHYWDREGKPLPGTIHICALAGPNALWDLLHELGHALHGHAPGEEKTCAHETAMWQRGWHWAVNGSGHGSTLTPSDKAAFNARAAECLASYCESVSSAVV